jgi:hypothetical protein
MPRRAHRSPKIGLMAGSLVGVLLLVGIGGYFFGSSSQPFKAPNFPVEEYLHTSSSLRGNSYLLSGAVLNAVAWSPESGRLISVGPEGSDSPIPVVIPNEFSDTNIQKGQRFHFLVDVRENGVVFAKDLVKP